MQDICVRYVKVRHGTSRYVTVRHDTERHGSTYKTSLIYFTNTNSFSKYNCLIFISFKHTHTAGYLCTVRHGTARYGTVRHGTARCVKVRHDTEWHGSTYKTSLIYFTNTNSFSKYNCLIFISFKHTHSRISVYGTARYGTVRYGTVRHYTERHGSTYKTSLIYFTNTNSFSKYNCLIFISFKHTQNIFCRNIWLLFEYLCRMGVHKRNSILTGHKSIAFSMTEAAKLSYAPFTLLRFCTKTEKNIRSCETVHTTSHKNAQKRRFLKCSSKWIFTKTELFETLWISVNAQKRIKNAATATTKYFTHFSPKSTLNLRKTKTYELEYIKFYWFHNQTVSNNQF